jgi:hypothetical protein
MGAPGLLFGLQCSDLSSHCSPISLIRQDVLHIINKKLEHGNIKFIILLKFVYCRLVASNSFPLQLCITSKSYKSSVLASNMLVLNSALSHS